MDTDVLIIGAGPTGLMAANQLARFDVDFMIIDCKAGPTRESRAIGVTPRSMEIYQQLGVADEIMRQSAPIRSVNAFLRGKRRARIELGEAVKDLSPFPELISFEQSKNESLLVDHLAKQGHQVRWETEFVSLVDNGTRVETTVRTSASTSTITSRYVIACDGASSPVRHQLGFRFEGGTYAHKFFVADTTLTWDLAYDQLIVAPGDESFCAFFPMPGERTYRVIGTLPTSYADRDDITFDHAKGQVANTLAVDVRFDTVNWFSVYKLHHRMVDQFSRGQVFLAGDSAHIHSPAGAQGMNTGLQDAYNLAWKLALVLEESATEDLLRTYDEERRPFARAILKFTDRAFGVITSKNWLLRWLRRHVLMQIAGALTRIPQVRQLAFRRVSQIAYSYQGLSLCSSSSTQSLAFRAGDRLPYLPGQSLYEKLRAPGFHLLHIAARPLTDSQREKTVARFPTRLRVIEEHIDDGWREQGVVRELFVLVRPDNYVAYVGDGFGGDSGSEGVWRYLVRSG